MSDNISLYEFRINIEELKKSEYPFNNILNYLRINRNILPEFPKSNFAKKLFYCDLPIFCKEGYSNIKSIGVGYFYQGIYYLNFKRTKQNIELKISPNLCIGNTWLYCKSQDNKPDILKLTNLLLGEPSNIPCPDAYKAGEYYVCTDGNHRIYAAYLLGYNIRVDCSSLYTDIFDEEGNKI